MKRLLVAFAAFASLGIAVFGTGMLADPSVAPPQPISEGSPCPATACASGECHGFGDVPQPDGIHEMLCPEAGCSSVDCHAWDTLETRYKQASDASLNIWLLVPGIFAACLVLLVKKVK